MHTYRQIIITVMISKVIGLTILKQLIIVKVPQIEILAQNKHL